MTKSEENCDCNDLLTLSTDDLGIEIAAENDISLLAEMFNLLRDPTRMKILLALSQKDLCVCELSVAAGMTVSAISHQLRILRNGRIVKNRRSGKSVYYSLDDDHIRSIIKMSYDHIRNNCQEKINL